MQRFLQINLGIALLCLLGLAKPLNGQVLLFDNFDYPSGDSLTSHNWIQQQSISTNPILVNNGGLSYPGYICSDIGNAALLGPDGGQDIFRGFVKQTLPGTLYLTCLARVTSAVTTGEYFISFKESATSPTNTTYRGRVWAIGDGSGNIAFGVTKGALTAPMIPNYTDFIYSLNTTYLLVMKFTIVAGTVPNDSAQLFINPVIGNPEPAPSVICPDVNLGSDLGLGSVFLRQGAAGLSPTVIVDGVRVSKSWQTALNISNISTLSDLKVDGISVTGFSPDVYSYNDTVPTGQTSVAVAATTTDWASTAVTTVTQYIPGISTVTVTSEDGTSNHTYHVNHAYAYHTIDLSVSPEGSGTVTGGGVYGEGFEAIVNATNVPGYQFVNWTDGGVPVSDNPVYSFIVTGARSLVANFIPSIFQITATAIPQEGGTITGTGPYPWGSEATLTAYKNTGYLFVDWRENDVVVGTDTALVLSNITSDHNLSANFSLKSYTVTGTANPPEGGTVTGSGMVTHGGSITLTALKNTGYSFVNWTENGNVIGADSVLFLADVSSDHYVVANFGLLIFTVTGTANPPEGGTVAGSGTVNYGGSITLTASQNTGYTFTDWTENGIVIGTDLVLEMTNVTTNHDVVANFGLMTFTVSGTANPPEGGTVAGSGTVNYGGSITLTASQNTGYNFIDWTENGIAIGTDLVLEMTNVTANHEVVANFGLMTFTVSGTANPPEGGTVTGSGTVNYGDSITLTAFQNTGYNFIDWTENGIVIGTDLVLELTNVTANHDVVANFGLMTFTVSGTANPSEGGTVAGSGIVNYGDNITLTASQNTGYTFTDWTENGNVIGTDLVLELTNVTANHDVVANFELMTFEINVTVTPEGSGTVTGEGTVNYGSDHTLTASPTEGYIFDNWSENGVVLDTIPSLTLTNITSDHHLLATFIESIDIFTVTGAANPVDGGTVTGSGNVPEGGNITLTALRNTGYVFVNWTENATAIGTDTVFVFENVTSNHNVLANFELLTFQVTATANPPEGGIVTGSGSVPFGGNITLTASQNEGYVFVNWTEDNIELGTSTSLTLTDVQANHTILANFREVGVGVVEPAISGVEVYPTITAGIVYVKVSDRIDEICVTDMAGRTIWKQKSGEKTAIIQTSPWNTGTYLVRVNAGDKVYIRRIIKR